MTPRPNGGTAPDLAALNALAADQETPPATVEEAVLRAMEDCQGTLVFGAAVNWGESIGTLSADAGPPEKVLRYLRARRVHGSQALEFFGHNRSQVARGERRTPLGR